MPSLANYICLPNPNPNTPKEETNGGCRAFEEKAVKTIPGIFNASKPGNSSNFNPPTLFLAKINRSS